MVEHSKIVTQDDKTNVENQDVIAAVEQAVATHQLFGDLLTVVEKEYLLDRGIVRSVAPGIRLCRQYQRDDRVYILVVGEVEASSGEDIAKTHIANIRQGELFGEIAALFGMPRICDITVTRPSVVLEVPSSVLRTIIEARVELREAVMQRFRARITETALRAVPLFRYLPDDSMQQLVESASLIGIPPGSILIEEGEVGDAFYVIVYGNLRVSHDVSGRHLNLALLQPGDFFGEWSILTGAPRAATVSALMQSELVAINRDAFLRIMELHPEIRERIDLEAHNRFEQLSTADTVSKEVGARRNLDEIKHILRQQK
ncbi:MAG: cyclic nucleotide-binding domain-containing protein [Gammaproteobacteria bacterium]|jgi:cAMP-dependent protein kinase regulator